MGAIEFTLKVRVVEPYFIVYLYTSVIMYGGLLLLNVMYWRSNLLGLVSFGGFGIHGVLSVIYTVGILLTLKIEKKDCVR